MSGLDNVPRTREGSPPAAGYVVANYGEAAECVIRRGMTVVQETCAGSRRCLMADPGLAGLRLLAWPWLGRPDLPRELIDKRTQGPRDLLTHEASNILSEIRTKHAVRPIVLHRGCDASRQFHGGVQSVCDPSTAL